VAAVKVDRRDEIVERAATSTTASVASSVAASSTAETHSPGRRAVEV
jgi:hypothetical protein